MRVVLVLVCLLIVLSSCGNNSSNQAALEQNEWLPGGKTTNTLLLGANAFSRPVANISVENKMLFFSGNSFFNQPWVTAPASTTKRDGLGPLFNANSCAACHFKDGRGRPPIKKDEAFLGLLLRLDPNDASHHLGGQVQPFAINDVPIEAKPSVSYQEITGTYPDGTAYALLKPQYHLSTVQHDIAISPRVAPAVFGVGLLEAIPEQRIKNLSDPEDLNGDGISGQINWLEQQNTAEKVMGRMGWKAEKSTVEMQSAAAFNGDIGITSALFPNDDCTEQQIACQQAVDGGKPEIDEATLHRVVTYSSLLAPPVRQNYKSSDILSGKKSFHDVGCAACHTPSHQTSAEFHLTELSDVKIWPYTDLLLHDMGADLADQNSKNELAAEWRTPPLWGISYYQKVNKHTRLMHDGRARNVEEAILWHGGEAESSVQGFMSLHKNKRKQLVQFVESL